MSTDNIIQEMRALFNGCDSTIDAIQMSEPLFLKYPHLRNLIISYRDSLKYPDNIDLMTKVASLESVYNTASKDDALDLKSTMSARSNDSVYIRALERIVSRKRNKRTILDKKPHDRPIIAKNCPHCGEVMRMADDTTYVICGYPDENRGYDWKGCCGDWCFACGKMLCKSWEQDELNVEGNRTHNDECCKLHSKKNGHVYPDDYCQCLRNKNVTRKDYSVDISGFTF